MSLTFRHTMLFLFFAVAMVFLVPGAAAQDKAETSGKKVLVKVTTIENGDTTVTEKEVGEGDAELEWVDEKEGDVLFISGDGDDDEEIVIHLKDLDDTKLDKLIESKDGKARKVIVKKMRSGDGGHDTHGKSGCCMERSSCCSMDKDGHHMKMDAKDGAHKKMMWKEKDDDRDGEKDEEKEEEEDDDGLF